MGAGAAPSRRGFLGLGSNLGDRRAHLRAAIEALERGGVEVRAVSGLYETAPVGEYEGKQPDFLNMVVEIGAGLDPHELLDLCKAVEVERGRDLDGPRHGPRPLDLDILLLDDIELASDRLRIPHPGLTERRFVLEPLAELAPDLRLPGGRTAAEGLEGLRDQRVGAVGPLD